jgi:hypothetical protein
VKPSARTFGWVVIALLIAALTVTLLTATLVGADNTNTIRTSQRANAETLRLIQDCTQPGGECYDRGQKQTADVVADLNRAAVYAAACADKPGVQGKDEIYACVIRLFAADKP